LGAAFAKLAKAQAHSKCSFAIVVGDLFGDGSGEDESGQIKALLDGSLVVPLPTYFSVGNNPLPQLVVEKLEIADEVCPNLIFLGRKGMMKTSEGIRIACLGGKMIIENSSAGANPLSQYSPHYMLADARGLHGAHSADILITNQFPQGILNGSQAQIPDNIRSIEGERCISDLCATLKPRYHFASSPESWFKREPFEQPADYESTDHKSIVFFESLASFAKSSKELKWHSAFRLDPSTQPPELQNLTTSPFSQLLLLESKKRRALEGQNQAYSRYNNGTTDERPHKRHRKQVAEGLAGCFFCMTDPGFRTHLVAAIGTLAYLTVPKGPLPLRDTFSSLGFPGHILIIPTLHTQEEDLAKARDDAEAIAEYDEVKTYRKALYKMIQQTSAGSLGAVCWEANRSRVRHQHFQFCPVLAQYAASGLAEAAFKLERENNDYPLFQSCDPEKVLKQKSDYFRLWIWWPSSPPRNPVAAADQVNGGQAGEGMEKSMFFPLPSNQKFDLQFGRKVMAKVLKLEHRSDWRNTEQTEREEERDRNTFKAAFEEFDPFPDL
jgi:Protein similar to CwfJ C-terminus 1/Protein similar to CwfJ C-terminus 2